MKDADPLAAPFGEREFEFTRADFERVRKLIYARAGIALSDAKYQLAYGRVARRLRVLGIPTFLDYLDRLEAGTIDEWQEFVNALTTNLTAFFREPHHFPILGDHLRAGPNTRRRRVWCCAASTGEEPYSIAMTAIEAYGSDRPPIEIVATDIDTNCLETAERGAYRADAVARLGADRLKRFFLRGAGPNEGWVRVRPAVRELVTFDQLNLLDPNYGFDAPFDAIFCRNVMIYFDKPTQLAVLARFAPLLLGDGLLFCGHSENFAHARNLFQLKGKTVYALAGGARRQAQAA